jgi:hypothetical protein
MWVYTLTDAITRGKSTEELEKSEQGYQMKRERKASDRNRYRKKHRKEQ